MSDIQKVTPAVAIFLDKERRLKLTLSGMVAFEKETGKSLMDGRTLAALGNGAALADIRALLWACLRHEDKALTPEEVGDLITTENLLAVVRALGEAFGNAMPETGKDGAAEKDPLATTGT